MAWFIEPKLGKSLRRALPSEPPGKTHQRANTYKMVLIGSQLFPQKPFLLVTYAKQNHIHLIISRVLNESDNLKNI